MGVLLCEQKEVAHLMVSAKVVPLWRCCNVIRYSRSQRFQKMLARYWICRQRRWQYWSCSEKTPGEIDWFDLSNNKWLGVRGSASIGSSGFGVRGREFLTDSVSAIRVSSDSSLTSCSGRRALRILLTDWMILFQTPPMWLAVGGLKIQLISRWLVNAFIFYWFHFDSALRSSRLPPWKLVLLSLLMISGLPLLAINLRRASMNEFVSKECEISMWTALEARQVNKHP